MEELLCPYCKANNTPEDVPSTFNPHECECLECGEEFIYDLDWTPDYYARKKP